VQGYNAQAVVTEDHVVVARLLAFGVTDLPLLASELGEHRRPESFAAGGRRLAVLAGLAGATGAGRPDQQLRRIRDRSEVGDRPVAGVGQQRTGPVRDLGCGKRLVEGLQHGLELLQVVGLPRERAVEPVFGQLKEQQAARRFTRRGLQACEAEWKLLCGIHNLLKLWRHTRRQTAAAPTAT
jgi:Transposase DDE domain